MACTYVLAGLPGCGKSTAIELIEKNLCRRGFKVATLDLDSDQDTPLIRLAANPHPFDSPARTLLFWALRLKQYDLIQQARKDNDVILIDSFWWVALANDVYGNGVPREFADWASRYIKQWPDVTFFLDVPLEVARKRKKSKTMADLEFAKRVWQGYQELSREFSWVRIDANQTPSQVATQCLEIIITQIPKSK